MGEDPLSPAALEGIFVAGDNDGRVLRNLRRVVHSADKENRRLRAENSDLKAINSQLRATIAAQKLVINRLVDGAAGRLTQQEDPSGTV